jgi:hypothetical protein
MDEKKREDLELSGATSLYECCGFLDLCTDADLMSLSFAGTSPFLDWLSWRPTNVCEIRKWFMTWVRPEMGVRQVGEGPQSRAQTYCTSGVVEDPCGDAEGVQAGGCGFLLRNFGRLRREGPVRDITKNALQLCELQPRYRLDGSPITDMREMDMRLIMEVLTQDLQREVITGHTLHDGDGNFDGLQQLIKTDYHDPSGRRCKTMDSIIVEWNHNDLDGGDGITWNGVPVANTYDFVEVLQAIIRNIKQKIAWAPSLAGRALRVGDVILMMPTFLTTCLLNMYTCWSLCVESVTGNYESRAFRNQLNGGMFGFGKIFIDGFEIPLMAYDWGTIQGPTTGDVYVLTGSIGGQRVLEGQFNDMRSVPGSVSQKLFEVTDGGKILTWEEYTRTCYKRTVEMQPRLLSWAPWAQARIENVVCRQPGPVLGPDPCESSYFPESSFYLEECKSA